jgi:lipoprotein-anchoring transpeptidase ErfK/SrfK
VANVAKHCWASKHSIFSMKDGHAIHGSYEVKNLGKPVSHGCVRILPENATTLYALVKANGGWC